jgi:uncharacterized protein (TIGR02118 family)
VQHLVVAWWRAPGVDPGAIAERWTSEADAHSSVRTSTVSVAVGDQGRFARGDPVDMLITLALDHAGTTGDVPGYDVLASAGRQLEVWEVEPNHAIVGDDAPLTMVSFVERAAHLSHDEFARHWTEQHAPLARRHHVGLADYTQHIVVRSCTSGGANVDGIAELRFRNRDDFENRFYDSDDGRDIIREDVQRFIARPSAQAALLQEVSRITR